MLLYCSQAPKRQVHTAYCKPQEKCETNYCTGPHGLKISLQDKHVSNKSILKTHCRFGRKQVLQSKSLEERGELLSLAFPTLLASAPDRRKAKHTHGPQDSSGERRGGAGRLSLAFGHHSALENLSSATQNKTSSALQSTRARSSKFLL